MGPGEGFGEIALLLDVPRTATVRAVDDTKLLSLNAGDFNDLLLGYLSRSGELAQISHSRLASDREPTEAHN